MKEISLLRESLNVEKLDGDLRAVLGSNYVGLSTRFKEVIVFMADGTPSADVLQAQQLLVEHDPSQLTVEQVAKLAEEQALTDARLANSDVLDLSQFSGENEAIAALAAKILWLEREIRDLRGL